MVLQLDNGKYLHTAYAISNIAEELGTDDWSLTDQEGMLYIGTYIDGNSVDSTDPTAYNWEELVDEDVDDEDSEGIMPVADFQSQIDALADQIDILQSDASDLAVSIAQNADNISNGTNLASEANDIAKATGQHFWTDDSGAHVTEATQEEWNDPDSPNYQSGANSLWNSLGILFRRGLNNLLAILAGGADGTGEKGIAIYDGLGNALSNIVAKFTDAGSIIGKQDESHLKLDYHSMQMVDKDGVTYLYISDLRNEDGNIVQTETGDGWTYIFPTLLQVNEVISVTVDGVTVSATAQDNTVVLDTTPADGSEVIITYIPFPENYAKAYTLGQRLDGAPIGAMSVAEGVNNSASGNYSHVEGGNNVVDTGSEYGHAEGSENTITSCHYSHVEGTDNRIEGSYAHAEGIRNKALSDASHVEGEGNIASGWGQHVVGRYNEETPDALEIVGNGSTTNLRSNARVLYTNGNEWLADTLVVSRNPTRPMEVATKQYVDNSGGGGGTSDYTQLSNKPQINGITLTGNKSSADLSLVPSARTVNSKALTSDITLDASDVGALPDTTVIPTKVSDLTNDSGYIPKDDLFFKPGDVYTVSYNHARALTGYISSSTTGIYFEIPLPKFLTDVTSANITAMTGGVRGVGGYVNGLSNGSNLKSGFTVTASVDNPNTLYVSVVKGSALTNATNNTPISVALNSISITFS